MWFILASALTGAEPLFRMERPRLNTDLPQKALDLWRQGMALEEIADLLNTEGCRTATGAEFQATTVWRMISRVDPAESHNREVRER
jgi:hypothetical protein